MKLKSASNQGDEKQVLAADLKAKRAAYIKACLNIARNCGDLPVIFFFMKSKNVSASIAGSLGCFTSAISLYNMWGQKW